MERLQAEIRANQANHDKAEVPRKARWTSQEEMKAMMDTGLEKREAVPKEVEALVERHARRQSGQLRTDLGIGVWP